MTNNSTISLDYVRLSRLPRLAWLLELEYGSSNAKVMHGDWVEAGPDGFFEGAWAGEFSLHRFDEEFMTGTGAALRNGSLLFVTPSHTLDRVNVMRKDGRLYVSNSLAFILAMSEESLDDKYLFYDSCVASIRFGTNNYERSIRTNSKIPVEFYYRTNVRLGAGHELIEESKRPSPDFATYESYRAYLGDTIRSVALNARDNGRIVKYGPIATLSKGYDSPASAVLAMEAGCNQVVTFRESRGTAGSEDCGTEIAKRLGLAVEEFGRFDYREASEFPEVRNSGGPSEFLSFGNRLRGALLFTGFNGDMIWNRSADPVTRDFVRTDSSGSSLTEFRLDAGFAHLPVPFVGADSHPSIHAISNSPSMKAWTLGNSYDRPIARRIVEQAGVPRHMFGQKKRAAGVVVSKEGLAGTMSAQSLLDFERYARERWNIAKAVKMACFNLLKKLIFWNERAKRISRRLMGVLGIQEFSIPIFAPHRLRMLTFGYLGQEALLFHWGQEKLVRLYKDAKVASSIPSSSSPE